VVVLFGLLLCGLSPASAQPGLDAGAVSPLDNRLAHLGSQAGSRWIITPYRPNYILPLTYSFDPNNESLGELGEEDEEFDRVEVKFQLSLMLSLLEDAVWSNGDLCLGYTQVSYWNAYNSDLSSPFRDTNYEPELFLLFDTDLDLLGLKNRAVSFGFVHQSNGRGADILSRSWNRVYANFMLQKGDFALSLKPWWRLPEDDEDDDNPNMERYLGYGEMRAFYKRGEQVFSVLLRNNLKTSGNKGAIEAGWSFPLHRRLKGFVQYFNGYGESLLDYDYKNQRVGMGLLLSDWL
jgi:phospholipase A1